MVAPANGVKDRMNGAQNRYSRCCVNRTRPTAALYACTSTIPTSPQAACMPAATARNSNKMLSVQEMRCIKCGEYYSTTLKLQVDRGEGLVRFQVDCDRCGVFSHYLEYNEINRAVKRYLDSIKARSSTAEQGTHNLLVAGSNPAEPTVSP